MISVPVAVAEQRHVVDVEGWSRAEIERMLDRAEEMRAARASRVYRSLLDAETVGLAFFETSTRTRISFELAAKALGATVVDLQASSSSLSKGESLVDTLRTLERTGVTILVMRHASSGAPDLAVRATGLRVVNGGDGTHAHPTQALLDALTLRERFGSLDGRLVAIVGDVAHSRVARSNIHALQALGARVRVAGPEPWIAGFDAWPGVETATSLADGIRDADAVMTLRVQLERDAAASIGSLDEYIEAWRLDEERTARWAAPDAPILHPGPTNEGVEITAELANGPRSLIGRQVENGVPIRMAVLATVAGAV
ncbi:MAG TPA: aspartate carbamoyltransferase catalytic subunit [Candidatus Limnocylindria bacterium]|nr:aspartate carbamoyltransferase catalytic subunit [Candidatus Limnocylindria bacterium]